jgi:hypothetical protein
MKKSAYIILFSLLFFSCFNKNKEESVSNKSITTKSIHNTISNQRDILDTIIYKEAFPPRDFLIENLINAPIIAEGKIVQADSINEWNEKVVTFKIDSVWKGSITQKTIQYGTYNETTIYEYESWKKFKSLIFIKKTKKQKLENYKDSIEYFPIVEKTVKLTTLFQHKVTTAFGSN